MVEVQLPPLEDVPAVVSVGEEEKKPEWFNVLLRTNFWEPCMEHAAENRAEKCMFCLHCYNVSCPHCTHDEPGHRLLKIRRYVYRSVVLAKDMQNLDIDVSRIQTYIINGQRVVHLRPMNRSKLFRPPAGTPGCLTCGCWLRVWPNSFCSLTCQEEVDVSQDDFSGPEAERRYRSHQTNMLEETGPSEEPPEAQEDHVPEAQEDHVPEVAEQENEPPAASQSRSFRRRGRKGVPNRAPFF
ncbi:hypothetical protein SETIT_9G373300v2 [Setaria italica]|uniref:B box-type domain-containing protein n=1 Tax=Setaria italica TaxID=4555 RepID=K4AL52_SETIT|nr:hypothetical protein SETIT_9G373300v2 [Setaria italica]